MAAICSLTTEAAENSELFALKKDSLAQNIGGQDPLRFQCPTTVRIMGIGKERDIREGKEKGERGC